MTADPYERLSQPPIDGLDATSCEYLAFEDARIAAAINFHADILDAACDGKAALAIVELRTLAQNIQTSAQRYLAAQQVASPRE